MNALEPKQICITERASSLLKPWAPRRAVTERSKRLFSYRSSNLPNKEFSLTHWAEVAHSISANGTACAPGARFQSVLAVLPYHHKAYKYRTEKNCSFIILGFLAFVQPLVDAHSCAGCVGQFRRHRAHPSQNLTGPAVSPALLDLSLVHPKKRHTLGLVIGALIHLGQIPAYAFQGVAAATAVAVDRDGDMQLREPYLIGRD